MRWFGDESWGAPVCDDLESHVRTPTGRPCQRCNDPIEEGDRGFVLPFCSNRGMSFEPWHYHCLLTSVSPMVIHGLRNGYPRCRFSSELPRHWPAWNCWSDQPKEVTCEGCKQHEYGDEQ